MPRIIILAALVLLATPARAACPDILVGDSLAVGMAPYARADGWRVVARVGAGLAWLRALPPRCADRIVLVLGTNDLPQVLAEGADAYVESLALALTGWRARQVTWATPGCFARHPAWDQASAELDRRVAALPGASRGRELRCHFASPDGIHPGPATYRAWWDRLRQTS